MDDWLGEPLPLVPAEQARAELTRRWLASFGPAGLDDLKWWSGWTRGQAGAALAAVEAEEVELDGERGYVLPGDLKTSPPPPSEAWLLPSLDPTVMGWKNRNWYLGEYGPRLFDRNGNAGPTIWWKGRVVGGWGQLSSGQVSYRLFEDLGREGEAAVAGECARLEAWLEGIRLMPRFRTPLEKELSA
jgi:hypothetical protein